jgi:hypothetical protein
MFRGLLATLVVALVAGAAFATPTVTVNLTLANVYTDNTDTVAVTGWQANPTAFLAHANPTAYDYDFQVTVQFSNMGTGETFDNLLLKPYSSTGNTISDLPGTLNSIIDYAAQTSATVTIPGKTGGTFPLFKENDLVGGDGKTLPYTSQFSVVANNVSVFANPGVSAPLYLGDVWVNDTNTSVADTFQFMPATGLNNASTWIGGTATAYMLTSGNIVAPGVVIGAPEPATMALLAIGGIGALLRRRNA